MTEQLGPYRLIRRLGRGGMGEVWLAEHEHIKSQVAIKLVLGDPNDEDAAARFLREARATAKIRHPGVIAVSDFGVRPGGGAYLVMELLDGENLAERLQRGPLPLALVLELGVQIAEALAAAHAADVIHRDLKPANVFLVPDAAAREAVRAKLLDFGVAKSNRVSAEELGLTATGAVVGTPVYMAPEQCTSRLGPVDHRVDLYSLGILLYEMTTGTRPFSGKTFGDLIDQHLNATPTPPRVLKPSIPSRLDVLIMKLLAKQRDDRPATASEVAHVLDEIRIASLTASLDDTLAGTASHEPATLVSSSLTTQATEARAPNARFPRLIAIAGGVIVLAGVGVAVLATREAKHAPPKDDGGDLERACLGTDGQACLILATREQRDPAPPDLVRVYTRFKTACDRKIVEGCAETAARLSMGVGVRPDYAKARTLAGDACKSGSALGCEIDGNLLWRGIGGPVEQTEGLTRWRRGCELGSSDACQSAAELFQHGLGVPRDEATAHTLFLRANELAHAACVNDDARACVVLGQLTANGVLAAADSLRGADYFRRACELGNGNGCAALGELHVLGTGVARDSASALEILRRGCERGDPNACVAHGLGTIQGSFGEPDPKAGFAILQTACEVHGDRYCASLGLLHAAGMGTPKDATLAKQYLERACAAGEASSCSTAAELVVPNVDRDPARLEALHHRACQLGETAGCMRLGKLALQRGDHDAARTAYEIACELSLQQSGCDLLADMYFDGVGVPKDPARGRALLENACRLAPIPCYQLARRLRDGRGLEKRPIEAMTLLDKACQLGVGRACLAAAVLLTKPPRGITTDAARAKVLRERGCTLDTKGCTAPESKL